MARHSKMCYCINLKMERNFLEIHPTGDRTRLRQTDWSEIWPCECCFITLRCAGRARVQTCSTSNYTIRKLCWGTSPTAPYSCPETGCVSDKRPGKDEKQKKNLTCDFKTHDHKTGTVSRVPSSHFLYALLKLFSGLKRRHSTRVPSYYTRKE